MHDTLPITNHQLLLALYYAIQSGRTPAECNRILADNSTPHIATSLKKLTFSPKFAQTPTSGNNLLDHWVFAETQNNVPYSLSWDPTGNPIEILHVCNSPAILRLLHLAPPLQTTLTPNFSLLLTPTPFNLPLDTPGSYQPLPPSQLLPLLRLYCPDMPNDEAFLNLLQETFTIRIGIRFKNGTPSDHTLELSIWFDTGHSSATNFTFVLPQKLNPKHHPAASTNASSFLQAPASALVQAYVVASCTTAHPHLQAFSLPLRNGKPRAAPSPQEQLLQWLSYRNNYYLGPQGPLPSHMIATEIQRNTAYIHIPSLLPSQEDYTPTSFASLFNPLHTALQTQLLHQLTC